MISKTALPLIWRDKTKLSDEFGMLFIMVKELVESHGGSIRVSSQMNEETSLTVRFPSHRTNQSAQALPLVNSAQNLSEAMTEKDRRFIQNLQGVLEQHFQETHLNARSVYTQLAMSERQFHRKMKALLAQSFSDYVRSFRLRKGAQMLCDGITVTQTAFDCGFTSQSYFSVCFKAQYGMTPKKYQMQEGPS